MNVLQTRRTDAYQPGLAWFTALGSTWVFVLVMLGAFTTSIGAGMIFPDWPLSNGSLNPEGWLNDLAMFAEHSHRLSAGLMGLITAALAYAVWRYESRSWVRKLAWFALALVLVQALVGGLRVVMDHLHVEMVNTSVGRLFAMAHAGLAQIYVCSLLGLSLALSRPWIESPRSTDLGSASWRGLAVWSTGLLLVQLAIAAIMRHSFAGLAIPTFPLSTPQGDVLPQYWSFRVGIHFAHRAMAVVITIALVWLALRIWKEATASRGVRHVAAGLLVLLGVQIALGAASVLTYRNPYYTTAHVAVGALTLASCFGLTLWSYRSRLLPDSRPSTDNSGIAPTRAMVEV